MKNMIESCGVNRYIIRQRDKMRVDVNIYLSAALLRYIEDEAIQQLVNGACLPGVCHPVIGLPDIHTGFGLPIGGVMATCGDEGAVSAGAVGMDINCGVRLLVGNWTRHEINRDFLKRYTQQIEELVPCGVGKKSKHAELDIEAVLVGGAAELIRRGYGYRGEEQYIEECGCMAGADPGALSKKALSRTGQLSTLGGGNHFIELGYVAEVYDREAARDFGLSRDAVTVMIHTGSRGLGHQVCTDYSQIMVNAAAKYGIQLPAKGLACVPAGSPEGQKYFGAMRSAVNFAFANRQLIAFDARMALEKIAGSKWTLRTVYDVAHNIAKYEDHFRRTILVHRKGATRALPSLHPDNPPVYRQTGHPAIIPGSMGSDSYVVVGTDLARETLCSVNHGAGRVLSRREARKTVSREDFRKSMEGVVFNEGNLGKLLDEAPQAYKPISQVVETLVEAGITKKVARIAPLAVIKGEDD
ncbi:RtcB family protein [Desulfallas sp. Bu1-1]|uniref:RtcB family protein n=1 Tax=Desulfallas sp. Bu1-1 TaxID=2787620 RepID=UPI00189EDA8C|nr:RtcB family protein [Desulfallas sp. Bu1-1]MBF7081998.1 RtcB family protein [Desulfallas sp. Bu1-1]